MSGHQRRRTAMRQKGAKVSERHDRRQTAMRHRGRERPPRRPKSPRLPGAVQVHPADDAPARTRGPPHQTPPTSLRTLQVRTMLLSGSHTRKRFPSLRRKNSPGLDPNLGKIFTRRRRQSRAAHRGSGRVYEDVEHTHRRSIHRPNHLRGSGVAPFASTRKGGN